MLKAATTTKCHGWKRDIVLIRNKFQEERQKERKTERQKEKRKKDRKIERQKDRKTERQKDRKTERQQPQNVMAERTISKSVWVIHTGKWT